MYGIIGFPLTHSWSPEYFKEKLQRLSLPGTYQCFPIHAIESFPDLLRRQSGLRGLNVTHPYKEAVVPYLDRLDPVAAAIGAVNCIQIDVHGRTTGFNTDVTGFGKSLEPLLRPQDVRALILGTGGAAKAVAFALQSAGINARMVSRRGGAAFLSYDDLSDDLIGNYPLIINATPVGMAPELHRAPEIPYHALSSRHLLYDLIYNPSETPFLSRGLQQGARIKNGYEMLVIQAEASWEIWNRS